jgi:hypothetical protein
MTGLFDETGSVQLHDVDAVCDNPINDSESIINSDDSESIVNSDDRIVDVFVAECGAGSDQLDSYTESE